MIHYPVTWTNPCGGLRWQRRSNGTIEVEGEGTPALAPDSPFRTQLRQSWASWKGVLSAAAAAHDVPVAWMLAIQVVETGAWSDNPERQASIGSHAGAIGIMQIMPGTGAMFGVSREQLLDPAINADVGAQLIARLAKDLGPELPAITAKYNSGRLCSPGRNEWNLLTDGVEGISYPRLAILLNNTAIEEGLVGKSWAPWLFLGALAVGGGYYVGTHPETLRWLR